MANFMSTRTEIDGIVEKIGACNTKSANLIAELCVSKAKDKSLKDDTYLEIIKLLDAYPDEFKIGVLAQALVIVSRQMQGGTPVDKKSDVRADFFRHR
nr:MAG TPA: hypothetical protein [Caudoviricetes sp.]